MSQKRSYGQLVFIIATFLAFALILLIPATRTVFNTLSTAHSFLMGFVKFALLATAGELIAARMATGAFQKLPYMLARLLIWGVIGVWITYMMKVFFAGTGALMDSGLLPTAKAPFLEKLLHAFYTSATMNTTFGPTFMAVHKCSDAYLSLRGRQNGERITLKAILDAVDWHRFVSFTIFKTVPLFWIPAHTLTFLLPAQYQVMLAALLSVALGIILNVRKKPAERKNS